MAAGFGRVEGHGGKEPLDGGRVGQAFELVPFMAGANVHRFAQGLDLGACHLTGMIVLVAGERGGPALDGIGDEDRRFVAAGGAELLDEARNAVAAQIGHQLGQLGIAAAGEEGADRPLVADLVIEALAPGRAAAEHQRGIDGVGGGVDPGLEPIAARLGEGGALQGAVFEGDDVPVEGAENGFDTVVEPFADDAVEALAIVVDDPPGVAQAVLPAFEQAFVDIALVQLGIADQGNHAAFGAGFVGPGLGADIVLDQAGEGGEGDAEAHRAGGDVDVVGVLGAAGVGLGTAEGAEILKLFKALLAEQILDGVEDRRGVRLDRDTILGAEDAEIERGHDGGHGGGAGLVAADLDPVHIGADVVGVVDHPVGKPQYFAGQGLDAGDGVVRSPVHFASSRAALNLRLAAGHFSSILTSSARYCAGFAQIGAKNWRKPPESS